MTRKTERRAQARDQHCPTKLEGATHLGEGAVVPDVAVVGEAVADVAEAALLDVLLDGVEGLLLGDLHLGVGPAGDLDDHVEDPVVLVGEEGDVVEGRDDLAILLDVHAVLWRRQHVSATVTAKGRRRCAAEQVIRRISSSSSGLKDTHRACWVRR